MKKPSQSNVFDRVLIGLCLAILVGCIYLLSNDQWLSGSDDTSQLKAVGNFALSTNDVRRKHQNSLSWTKANSTDKVYEGDSIFTGEVSKAEVHLEHGDKLAIDPKSLVVIRTNGRNLELDLRYGAVSGKISEDQKIVLFNKGERSEISGKGAEIRITQKKGNQAKLEVISGNLEIKDKATGETKTLHKDQAADIATTSTAEGPEDKIPEPKVPEKILKAVELRLPHNDGSLWKKSASFTWSAQGAAGPFHLQFSKDPGFANVISEKTVTTETTATELPAVDSGVAVYWRVVPDSDPALLSSARKIYLYKDEPPVAIYPTQNQLFIVDTSSTDSSRVGFSWSDTAGSRSFNLQVSKKSDFKELALEQKVFDKSFETTSLRQGDYFWRVSGQHPERDNSPWSSVKQFSVIEKGNLRPPLPRAKENSYVLPLAKSLATPRNMQFEETGIPVRDAPAFEWAAVTGAESYNVGFEFNDGQNTAKQINVGNARAYQLATLKPGLYKWHVHAVFPGQRAGQNSELAKLKVWLPAPVIGTTKTTPTAYDVSWSPLLFAKKYEVQWSPNSTFEQFESAISKKSDNLILQSAYAKTGGLYWRVRALDSQSMPLSAFSESHVLREKALILANGTEVLRNPASDDVGSDQQMPVPQLREPRPETSVLSLGKTSGFVTFKWSAAGAQGIKYRIEISQSPDFTQPVVSKLTKQSIYIMDGSLPTGKIYWRVRSESSERRSRWANPSSLSITTK